MGVQEIETVIEETTRQALTGVGLDRVLVAEEVGEDGDPVLDIRIVYDDRGAGPTGEQMLDVQIELQDALRRGGEARLPIISFVARSEADQAA